MTESFDVDAFAHRNPIPAAARVGPMVWSSLIPPLEPDGTEVPVGVGAQFANVITNMAAVLNATGLTWNNVGKIDIWMRDPSDRGALNDVWLATFPDPATRPARQVHDGHRTLPPHADVVATFVGHDM